MITRTEQLPLMSGRTVRRNTRNAEPAQVFYRPPTRLQLNWAGPPMTWWELLRGATAITAAVAFVAGIIGTIAVGIAHTLTLGIVF